MNCGNCGKGNEYGAKICVHCGSTLALTEYFRRKGFVEKKEPPKKAKKEPWDQDILTTGYRSKHRCSGGEDDASSTETATRRQGQSSPSSNAGSHRRETKDSKADGSRQGNSTSHGNRSSRQSGASTRKNDSSAPREESTGGQRQSRGRATAGKERNKTGDTGPSSKASRSEVQQTPEQEKRKSKKIPKTKAYNHTTKSLSLAEKEVKKKTGKKERNPRKWILSLAVVLVILIVAAGIFIGSMHFSSDEDRYAEVAEAFVRAMVMDDEEALADYVHTKMHGSLTPLGYKNVSRCDTKIVECREAETAGIEQDLQSRYGITDSVRTVYRVHVGCTIYGEETYACTMDVYVAEIDGKHYAVKTENISNPG